MQVTIPQEGDCWLYFDPPAHGADFRKPTTVLLYSYRTGEAVQALFHPEFGEQAENSGWYQICDGHSSYMPTARGIYLNRPSAVELVAALKDMKARGIFRECFTSAPPPTWRWSALGLREAPLPPEAEGFQSALAKHHRGGGVSLRLFEPLDPADFENCQRWQSVHHTTGFLKDFLRHPTVLAPLGTISQAENSAIPDLQWHPLDPFHLSAYLASALYFGGAYGGLAPDYRRAMDLAQRARESLWGTNYDFFPAWSCTAHWCGWFREEMWNRTFLAVEPKACRITCLFTTDTD